MKKLLAAFLVFLCFALPAHAAQTLDGHAVGSSKNTTTVASATLTTATSGDTVMACVLTVNDSATAPTVSSIAGTGTTGWTKRAGGTFTDSNSHKFNLELWFGTASGTVGAAITATLSGSGDNNTIVVWGVTGSGTTFDANVSLPAPATNGGTTALPTVTYSTSNANDFIYGCLATTQSSPTLGDNGAGYTMIDSIDGFGSPNFLANALEAEYKVVTATQSSQALNFTNSKQNWLLVADALQAAGAAPTGQANPLMMLGAGP